MKKEYNDHVSRVRNTVFSDKDLAKHADYVRKVVKDPLERLMCSIRFQKTFGIMLLIAVMSLSGCGRAIQGGLEDTADNCSWFASKMSKHVDGADERRHKRNLDYVSKHLKTKEALGE